MLFLLLLTLYPSGAETGCFIREDFLIQQIPKADPLLTEMHGCKIGDRAHQELGFKYDFSFLPTRAGTYSSLRSFIFQPHYHFTLRLKRLGPPKVTPDSALLFHKKGGQCQNRLGKEKEREGGQ